MPRTALFACALALCLPGGAVAQQPEEAPPLVPAPPVAPEPAPQPDDEEPTAPAQTGQLPDTGADARLVAVLGAGLLLSGIGLRLRTTDERF